MTDLMPCPQFGTPGRCFDCLEKPSCPPATQADDALVEKLARAMANHKLKAGDSKRVQQQLVDEYWRDYIFDARAILPIIHRQRAAAHAAGRAAERAEVAAWLRKLAGYPASVLENYPPRGEVWVLHRTADAIERGQHGSKGDADQV